MTSKQEAAASLSQKALTELSPAKNGDVKIRFLSIAFVAALLSASALFITNSLMPFQLGGDDQHTALLLSGTALTHHPEYHTLFSNVLLTYPISCMYTVVPHVAWYPLCLVFGMWVALSVIAAALILRSGTTTGSVLFGILYFSSLLYGLRTLEFTCVSALLCTAGFAMSVYLQQTDCRAKSAWFVSGLFIAFGAMLRFMPFELTALIATSLLIISNFGKPESIKRMKNWAIWLLLTSAACFGLNAFNEYHYNSDPLWKDVRPFIKVAFPIADFRVLSAVSDQDLARLNLTPNDKYLLQRFFFSDESLYSTEALHDLSPRFLPMHESAINTNSLMSYLGSLLLVFLAAAFYLDKGSTSWRRTALWTVLVMAMLVAFDLFMKLPSRLYYCTIACMSALMLTQIKNGKLVEHNRKSLSVCVVSALIIACVLAINYKGKQFGVSAKENLVTTRFNSLLQSLSPTRRDLFVFVSGVVTPEETWADLPVVLHDFDVYGCGYLSRTPIGKLMLKEHGFQNLRQTLGSPNVYFIGYPRMMKSFATFWRQHYHQTVTFQLASKQSSLGTYFYRSRLGDADETGPSGANDSQEEQQADR